MAVDVEKLGGRGSWFESFVYTAVKLTKLEAPPTNPAQWKSD